MTIDDASLELADEIFISYAHVDNESPKKGLDGWITRFHTLNRDLPSAIEQRQTA